MRRLAASRRSAKPVHTREGWFLDSQSGLRGHDAQFHWYVRMLIDRRQERVCVALKSPREGSTDRLRCLPRRLFQAQGGCQNTTFVARLYWGTAICARGPHHPHRRTPRGAGGLSQVATKVPSLRIEIES